MSLVLEDLFKLVKLQNKLLLLTSELRFSQILLDNVFVFKADLLKELFPNVYHLCQLALAPVRQILQAPLAHSQSPFSKGNLMHEPGLK